MKKKKKSKTFAFLPFQHQCRFTIITLIYFHHYRMPWIKAMADAIGIKSWWKKLLEFSLLNYYLCVYYITIRFDFVIWCLGGQLGGQGRGKTRWPTNGWWRSKKSWAIIHRVITARRRRSFFFFFCSLRWGQNQNRVNATQPHTVESPVRLPLDLIYGISGEHQRSTATLSLVGRMRCDWERKVTLDWVRSVCHCNPHGAWRCYCAGIPAERYKTGLFEMMMKKDGSAWTTYSFRFLYGWQIFMNEWKEKN